MKITVCITIAAALLAAGCRGGISRQKSASADRAPAVTAAAASSTAKPVEWGYRVTAEYPHDTDAYTQGLFWHDGRMYESTGLNGMSELRRCDLATGRVELRAPLERTYFGEGAALLGDRIYQLTWISGRVFVYDAATLRRLESMSYDGEGWGIASDGERLYMSDGSEKIAVRDPESFAVERTITVTAAGRPVDSLNELEWIDGMLWANRYMYDSIVVIDPATGAVAAEIDLSGIRSEEDARIPGADVLNGIACDESTGEVYVTGKKWNKIYRIEVFPAE